jgi:hypothetical protein
MVQNNYYSIIKKTQGRTKQARCRVPRRRPDTTHSLSKQGLRFGTVRLTPNSQAGSPPRDLHLETEPVWAPDRDPDSTEKIQDIYPFRSCCGDTSLIIPFSSNSTCFDIFRISGRSWLTRIVVRSNCLWKSRI